MILLDDIGENLKPARELGMATILVRDTQTVLKELQELSGVQAGSRGGHPAIPWGHPDPSPGFCRAGSLRFCFLGSGGGLGAGRGTKLQLWLRSPLCLIDTPRDLGWLWVRCGGAGARLLVPFSTP